MTQEEELVDILKEYCLAHNEAEVKQAITRIMEWFKNWKDRK